MARIPQTACSPPPSPLGNILGSIGSGPMRGGPDGVGRGGIASASGRERSTGANGSGCDGSSFEDTFPVASESAGRSGGERGKIYSVTMVGEAGVGGTGLFAKPKNKNASS